MPGCAPTLRGHRFTVITCISPTARVEDSIRCGKATGLRNLPCKRYAMNTPAAGADGPALT